MEKRNASHGLCEHRLYKIWLNMRQRCNNPNNPRWVDYGGRGIIIDPRWDSVENFIADMEPSYEEGLTLDRRDNDLSYCVANCHWASRLHQTRNRRVRKDKLSQYRGVQYDKRSGKWEARAHNQENVRTYLGLFQTETEAALAYDKFIKENGIDCLVNFK